MLNNIIPTQRFEHIRDAIGRVLTAEFASQKALCDDIAAGTGLDVNIFLERVIPLDKAELPALNIIYVESEYTDENTSFTSLGDNKYLVEVYAKSPTTPSVSGDKASGVLLAKIMGMIRTMLMSDQYLFLDFTDKFIQTRKVKTITRTRPRLSNDAENVISGTIEVHYWAEEVTEDGSGTLETNLSTTVKLSSTNKGYKFEIVNV